MALYAYICTNEKCPEYNIQKDVNIPMSEYSEKKLPKCEKCSQETKRSYTTFSHQTFGDGYKG